MKKDTKEKKTIKNDQGHIIDALKKKDYAYVWSKVKYIGYRDIADVNLRYLVFKLSISSFNPRKNNNFIKYYKDYLKWISYGELSKIYTFTDNSRIAYRVMNRKISPSDDDSNFVKDLEDWSV